MVYSTRWGPRLDGGPRPDGGRRPDGGTREEIYQVIYDQSDIAGGHNVPLIF